jgi:hypothetical protein
VLDGVISRLPLQCRATLGSDRVTIRKAKMSARTIGPVAARSVMNGPSDALRKTA